MRDDLCYLGGPMRGCTDEETFAWRKYATEHLLCAVKDPAAARDFRAREADPEIDTPVVEGDKADIRDCNSLLVYAPYPSVGTSMEVIYAWERMKFIVTIIPEGAISSPWMRYHSDHVVKTLDDGIALINDFVLRGGKARIEWAFARRKKIVEDRYAPVKNPPRYDEVWAEGVRALNSGDFEPWTCIICGGDGEPFLGYCKPCYNKQHPQGARHVADGSREGEDA